MADAGADIEAMGDATVRLDGSASHAFPGDVTYSWRQTSGPAVQLLGRTTAFPTFAAPDRDAQLVFELVVQGAFGETALDTVEVVVRARLAITAEGVGDQGDLRVRLASNRPVALHKWDFGDGTSSQEAEPVHNFPEARTYQVRLVATDAEGRTEEATLELRLHAPEASRGEEPAEPAPRLQGRTGGVGAIAPLAGPVVAAILVAIACLVALTRRKERDEGGPSG